MKVQIKTLFFVILAIMSSSITYGAIKYGEAKIQKGNVIVVRDGRMYLYTTADNPVTLYENDTIRTLKNTALTLQNPDQNRMILGGNAIMQLKKWRQKKEEGTIRMLFGKFRARTAVLRKRSSLNIRTTTATIGIKGSMGEGATNNNFTLLANLSGNMSMATNAGNETNIPTGQFGFNVDGLNQNISLQENPNFESGKSEEELETGNTEQLNTEKSKTINTRYGAAVNRKIREIARRSVGNEQLGDLMDDFPELPDIRNYIDPLLDELQLLVGELPPTINLTIGIED